MNGNTFDEDNIPELIGSLEGSVAAPDPAAIHAGLSKRQAFRRRAISGAGAFIAVLAIAGGALALSGNNASTTETASGDAAVEEPDRLIFEFGDSVADDSAPIEEFPTTTVVFPVYVPEAVVLIDECANGSTISFGSEEWLAWELPAAWEGRNTVPVNIVINGNELVATDETGLTAPFVRNDGQGWPLPCLGFTYEQPSAGLVRIDKNCITGSSIMVGDQERWASSPIPERWHERFQSGGVINVTAEVIDSGFLAIDAEGLSAKFTLPFIEAERRGCVPFEAGTVTPLDEGSPTTTTSIAVEPQLPAPGPEAVLALEADIDGIPGDEQIWLDPDGTLHAGELVGFADYWDISDYWFDEQAELTAAVFDDDSTAIVLTRPIAEEDEDPPNVVQIFFVREQGLQRVLDQVIGSSGVHTITFAGDGTVSYVEDGWAACRHADGEDIVTRRRIILTADGDDGELIQTSTEDTEQLQDCNLLAG